MTCEDCGREMEKDTESNVYTPWSCPNCPNMTW